jgi:hypothetical protein
MSALTIRRELHRANFRACSRAAEMAAATLDREHCVVMGDRETLHAVLIEHMLTDVGDLRCVAVVHTVWLWARLHQLKRPDDAAAVRAGPSRRSLRIGAKVLVSLTDSSVDVRWSTPAAQAELETLLPAPPTLH